MPRIILGLKVYGEETDRQAGRQTDNMACDLPFYGEPSEALAVTGKSKASPSLVLPLPGWISKEKVLNSMQSEPQAQKVTQLKSWEMWGTSEAE